MLALRVLAADGVPHDPRPRMAELAARYPGALREIDALARAEIEARIALLSSVQDEASPTPPPWVHAMHRFHALARGVLFVKRTLGGRGEATSTCTWPSEATQWRQDVARIARPPRGRLMDLVYERLGRELTLHPAEAKRLVFGQRRR